MAQAKSAPKDLVGFLNYYLVDKAPFALPESVKELIVALAPWAAIILGVLSAFGALAIFGLSSLFGPFVLLGGGAAALGSAFLGAILLAVIAVLYFMAYPGLKARKMSGWTFSFYVLCVNVVSALLGFHVLSAAIDLVIGGYFLFQVRSYYK